MHESVKVFADAKIFSIRSSLAGQDAMKGSLRRMPSRPACKAIPEFVDELDVLNRRQIVRRPDRDEGIQRIAVVSRLRPSML